MRQLADGFATAIAIVGLDERRDAACLLRRDAARLPQIF
jgi:hypothetical protein